MSETRISKNQNPFIFFHSISEAKDTENTNYNVGEMPVGGFIKYKNKVYQIKCYNNETYQMEVINMNGIESTINSEENAYYLGNIKNITQV